jgi:ankyrin repeat protein
MQGSVSVLEELMKFDKQGVITARNRSTDSTALQLAAEGGHAELVKALIDAGANTSDENRVKQKKKEFTNFKRVDFLMNLKYQAGYAAVHLAAKNGHTNVLDALKGNEESIKLTSRKLGLTAVHIAAYYGQTGKLF